MRNRLVSAFDRIRVWHFAALFLLSFLAGGVMVVAAERAFHVDVSTSLTGAIVILAAAGGWVTWSALGQGLSLRALFHTPPSNLSCYTATVLAILAVYMLGKAEMHVLVPILERSVPSWADWYTLSTAQPGEIQANPFLIGLQSILIAPIFEEILFRGMIFQRWAYAWKRPFWALIAASALFSVAHGHILSSFIFAATATVLYLYTRSLWAPIIMHLMLNAISFAGIKPLEAGFEALSVSSDWVMGVFCATISLSIIFVFFWYYGESLQRTLPYIHNEANDSNSKKLDPRL